MEKRNKSVIKIAIVGPESTGKSFVSKKLAQYFDAPYVSEFAREYCEKLTKPCTWEDEINIFRRQLELENSMLPKAKKMLICDTTFLTVKIWSEHIFGKCPIEVSKALQHYDYDFHLLMNCDIKWEHDPLRDFPSQRDYFMKVWVNELEALGVPYKIIGDIGKNRIKNCIESVKTYLKTSGVKMYESATIK